MIKVTCFKPHVPHHCFSCSSEQIMRGIKVSVPSGQSTSDSNGKLKKKKDEEFLLSLSPGSLIVFNREEVLGCKE